MFLSRSPHLADVKFSAVSRGDHGMSSRCDPATNTMERIFSKHGAGLLSDGFGCIARPATCQQAEGHKEEQE